MWSMSLFAILLENIFLGNISTLRVELVLGYDQKKLAIGSQSLVPGSKISRSIGHQDGEPIANFFWS